MARYSNNPRYHNEYRNEVKRAMSESKNKLDHEL